jgi:double-stranded uracil-DNA glycosylase
MKIQRPSKAQVAAVARATGSAAELSLAELKAGRRRLEGKTRRYSPCWVAVVGIGAYRKAFERPQAQMGEQPDRIGASRLWVLPNPSGLNASHQLGALTRPFRALRIAAQGHRGS